MAERLEGVIEELRRAFAPAPLVPEGEQWHVGTTHTTAFMDAVRDRAWDEVSAEVLERHHDALAMLGPAAWVKVLPAFLVAVLRDDRALQLTPNFVLAALTRHPDSVAQFDARVELLSPAQVAAIKLALDVWRASRHGMFYDALIAKALASWEA